MIGRKNWVFIFGIILFILVMLAALIGPWLSPYDPERNDLSARLEPPLTPGHVLGTDALGRDLLTRLIYGARISLMMCSIGVFFGMLIGVIVGMLAGFVGGWVDSLAMRVVDVQLAFPFILLALTIASAVPPSIPLIILLLVLGSWVLFARTVRGSVLKEINREYVHGAVVLGASRARIATRYVLPNIIPTIAVLVTLEMAALILFESTLSFLGVGIQPPTPSWGGMMLEGQTYMRSAWWITTLPGVAIFLTVFSLNLVAEGLRDVLDPRLQR
jgi:peptide/nickel transport system permease protein